MSLNIYAFIFTQDHFLASLEFHMNIHTGHLLIKINEKERQEFSPSASQDG